MFVKALGFEMFVGRVREGDTRLFDVCRWESGAARNVEAVIFGRAVVVSRLKGSARG